MSAVVLLHGLIGAFCEPAAVHALRSWRVVAPDLPGYGSARAQCTVGVDHHARALAEVIEGLPRAERPVHLVAHSLAMVTAVRFAGAHPDEVASVADVEGNFSLADATWSAQVATQTVAEVAEGLTQDRRDPARWLRGFGIDPTPERERAAVEALHYQPARTLRAMSRSVVAVTAESTYEQSLRALFRRTPVHLVAGGRSRAGWHVPDWAKAAAAGQHELDGVGHLLMLEDPAGAGHLLARVLELADAQERG